MLLITGFCLVLLQVSHCHDSVVYILAPLKYVSVFGCSDSIIVLGAVGKVSDPSRAPTFHFNFFSFLIFVFHRTVRFTRKLTAGLGVTGMIYIACYYLFLISTFVVYRQSEWSTARGFNLLCQLLVLLLLTVGNVFSILE